MPYKPTIETPAQSAKLTPEQPAKADLSKILKRPATVELVYDGLVVGLKTVRDQMQAKIDRLERRIEALEKRK